MRRKEKAWSAGGGLGFCRQTCAQSCYFVGLIVGAGVKVFTGKMSIYREYFFGEQHYSGRQTMLHLIIKMSCSFLPLWHPVHIHLFVFVCQGD